MKNEYIYERSGKKGITLQIKVPYYYENRRTFKTESVRVDHYDTKADAYAVARMKRDELIVDIRNNRVMPSFPTVKTLYDRYWDMSQFSVKTKRLYDCAYREVMQQFADFPIDKITAADIQTVLSDYAIDHSQRSISHAKYIWKAVYKAALLQGINVTDKTAMIMPIVSRMKKKTNKAESVITYDEFVQFTTSLLNEDTRTESGKKLNTDIWYMLWVMFYTGCRPAEVLALERQDIDFENHVLHIVKSIGSTKKGTRQVVATKRPSSYRHIPMSDDLESLFHDLLNYSNSSPLLIAGDGKPYDIKPITVRIAKHAKASGIDFNAYQLRHKFSDDLFSNHVNPVIIRDLMGHASSTMSLEYAKATKEQMSQTISEVKRDS